jgi:hypothetical protein
LQQSALTAKGKKLAGLFDSLYLDKDTVLRYDFTYGQEMGLPEVRHLIVLPESMRRGAMSVPTTQWPTRRLKLPSPSCTRQCTLLACTDG